MRLFAALLTLTLASSLHAQPGVPGHQPPDLRLGVDRPGDDRPEVDRPTIELRPTNALRLREVRLAARAERRREGLWLFAWGVLSAVGGALVATIEHDDEAFLAAGVTTASFGVIDAVLALGLLDLSGARRRTILDDRSGVHTRFEDVREAELVGALKSGQGFAINAGLDVFYVAAGLLLFALGRARSDTRGWEEGAGLAMVGQGAFLLGFDLVAWIRSNRRADAIRAVR